MIEVKTLGGGLNKDDSIYRMPPNDYTDALNITHDAVEGSNDQVITNIVANRLVAGIPFSTFFSNPFYSITAIVVDNLNNTQTVTFTFAGLPDDVNAVTISYNDGTWHNDTGSIVSPRSFTITTGDYDYRLTLEFDATTEIYELTPVSVDDNYIVIGAIANTLRNTVIFMTYNSSGYHRVSEYNNTTRTIVNVFESRMDSGGIDILNFTLYDKITSINIFNRDEGDLLFFLDSLGRPTEMDITLFKAGAYTPVTREIIDVAPNVPLSPPDVVYDNDTTRRTNNFRNLLTRYKYRWILDDFSKTTFSPISKVPLPVSILSDTYTNVVTNNNVVQMVANTGGKNVKAIEIAFSYVQKTNDWSDFQSIITLNKSELGLLDNVDVPYAFYNDSTYPTIDIEESIELFDYVPRYANAQELANGNILAYIGITEGYNKDTVQDDTVTVGTIAAGGTGGGTSFSAVQNFLGNSFASQNLSYVFSGIPAVGTIVEVKIKNKFSHLVINASTYTTVAGDTLYTVAQHLAANNTAPSTVFTADWSIDHSYYGLFTQIFFDTYEPIVSTFYAQLVITSPISVTQNNSIPTFPWSTEQNIARGYFDAKGVTNGILYTDKVTYPAYAENGSQQPLLPYINYKINDIPPIWATSMQFYLTKEGTQYIAWVTNAVNTDETAYIYFDVSNFITNATKIPATATVLSYGFKEGDRIRIWREAPPSTVVFPDTYDAAIDGLVVDPIINLVPKTGTFIKIKNIAPFTGNIVTGKNYVLYIYTPVQQSANKDNQVYYEFGEQYGIIDAGLTTRRHSGMVTDQVVGVTPAEFNFYEGEAYFRSRTIAVSEIGYATYNVIDRNFVDIYISAVNSVDGRPSIIDINAREAYYSTLIRHGLAYQANTNINGLNRFYAKNFDEYDTSKGDALRLVMKDKSLIVMQKFKIGVVPLFSSIGKDPNGLTVVFNTDKLLNPIQYYAGDFGIGTCPESVASFNFAVYGCDNIKGAIWRLSKDGITPLSIMYKMNSWANDNLPLRDGNYKIYGAFDQKLTNYIIHIDEVGSSHAQTLIFDEENNRFESFASFNPEMMVTLGTTFISFKNGELWTHDDEPFYNNFYGEQFDSYITPVFNKQEIDKKTFEVMEQIASQAWGCPEIITSSNSYGSVKQTSSLIPEDFEELEGNFNTAFLGASNSIGGIIDGDSLKGNLMSVKLLATIPPPPNNLLVTLAMITIMSKNSPVNVR